MKSFKLISVSLVLVFILGIGLFQLYQPDPAYAMVCCNNHIWGYLNNQACYRPSPPSSCNLSNVCTQLRLSGPSALVSYYNGSEDVTITCSQCWSLYPYWYNQSN